MTEFAVGRGFIYSPTAPVERLVGIPNPDPLPVTQPLLPKNYCKGNSGENGAAGLKAKTDNFRLNANRRLPEKRGHKQRTSNVQKRNNHSLLPVGPQLPDACRYCSQREQQECYRE